MSHRSPSLVLAVAALVAALPAVASAATDKDVVVVNGASSPVPVQAQGTVSVTGGVTVLNTPSVSVANTPSVQLSPGASVAATQAGPWAVSVLPTQAALGTLSLGAPGTSNAIGPAPISRVSLGLTNAATTGSGGAGAGKASFGELVVTRALDASSPALFVAAAEGRVFPTASIVMKDATGATVVTFDLQDVLVSSLVSGTDGSQQPLETVGLTFAKITEQIGGASAGWDVLANLRL